jgi:hypothetical protein
MNMYCIKFRVMCTPCIQQFLVKRLPYKAVIAGTEYTPYPHVELSMHCKGAFLPWYAYANHMHNPAVKNLLSYSVCIVKMLPVGNMLHKTRCNLCILYKMVLAIYSEYIRYCKQIASKELITGSQYDTANRLQGY